jgi:hypothetical protein
MTTQDRASRWQCTYLEQEKQHRLGNTYLTGPNRTTEITSACGLLSAHSIKQVVDGWMAVLSLAAGWGSREGDGVEVSPEEVV